jgi:hypothetical protein
MQASRRRRPWLVAAAVTLGVAATTVALLAGGATPVRGPTVGEKLLELRTQRAGLQARADGEARIMLLAQFRTASLMTDALLARHQQDADEGFTSLPTPEARAFAAVDGLNAALRDALDRPGEGARLAAGGAARLVRGELEAMAGSGDNPLVLTFSPRFVPPRRGTAELSLAPPAGKAAEPPHDPKENGSLVGRQNQDRRMAEPPRDPERPMVARYAPAFVGQRDDDPAVNVEVVGLRLASDPDWPPTLSVGNWRGPAQVSPERLRFAVPRSAFATDRARTTFVSGVLSLRRASRTATFELLFDVLPDRPGSFALDQKVRGFVSEAKTLVSPEVLARAAVGETQTVRRCFDPPPGWRFDKEQRRMVAVEKLGWLDDVPDATLNNGSVEFAADEQPQQICVVVVAKPVTKAARTATIGRFEVALLHDVPEDKTAQSGVRALDWREAVRLPLESQAVEWKLYLRMLGEIDREFDMASREANPAESLPPFVRIERDGSGAVVLRADPAAEP